MIRALMERDVPLSQPVPSLPGQRGESPQAGKEAGRSRNRYQQLWERYSRDGVMGDPVQLDDWVGHQALEEGLSQQEIARMLIAGSPQVARLHREQGKDQARAYVNGVARRVCGVERVQRLTRQKERQLEL